ncbi:MAG: DUF421 domain-containing protein [Firmicutes bacterium]|nr:DUF421 domain-containing protein [Bacillota bacterium]
MSGALWYEVIRDVPALALRTILLYGVVLATMRWTGKRTVATMAPFDLALMIMISEVAAIPITELNVDLAHGLVPVILLGALHVLVTTINLRSRRFEALTEGRPTLLIARGRVLMENLRRERVSLADLSAALRLQQVTHLEQVEAAWLEPGGGVSILLRPADRPVTVRDLAALAGAVGPGRAAPAAGTGRASPAQGPGQALTWPAGTGQASPAAGARAPGGGAAYAPVASRPGAGAEPAPGSGEPPDLGLMADDLLPGLEAYAPGPEGDAAAGGGREAGPGAPVGTGVAEEAPGRGGGRQDPPG